MGVTITPARRVEARMVAHDWVWARENRERIAAHWEARRAARPAMFNGTVLMLRRWDLADGVLTAELFEAEYAALTALKDWGFPDRSVLNVFAAAVPRTSDGAYILGEMGPHTAAAGRVYFPCGTPDPTDIGPDGRVDLAASALRELREETGLVAPEGPDPGWAIVRDGGLMALLRPVPLGQDEATVTAGIAAHLAAEAEPELSAIVTVQGVADLDSARMPGFVRHYLAAVLSGDRAGG
ncbi:NUDIX hydrolase [Methylobacterium terricola]|uniref:NUDIX hydrolase n=1 Tax=Methylobacterium terricola TaxID=2583531 RepID=A0A5C4LLQ1_9HYPH|nr:NUDIX hydrolase [Methylobacterium terricola]TNC15742.1 NUDIX hydrolase [Methylobacterium terricola]